MSDTLRSDANAASARAWRIYPDTNVEDGMARTVYIAGYLAGIEEGKKKVDLCALQTTGNPDDQRQ